MSETSDTVLLELFENNSYFIDLNDRPSTIYHDLDSDGSSRLIREIEEDCRKANGTWNTERETGRRVHGTNASNSAWDKLSQRRDTKAYFPGSSVTNITTYLASVPLSLATTSIVYMIKGPVKQWLKNRGSRSAKIKIGTVVIELTGEDASVENVLKMLGALPEWAAAAAVSTKALPTASKGEVQTMSSASKSSSKTAPKAKSPRTKSAPTKSKVKPVKG
jgi:hypothetical protein